HVGEILNVGVAPLLVVGRVVGGRGDGDVVDEVAVVGILRGQRADIAERGVQIVFVAGVVDEPEIGSAIGLDAASAVAVDHVIDDERGRRVAAQVEDDAVAVGVIARAVVFAGDDVVGGDVVEAGVIIEPLGAVVGDGAGPAVEVAV